MSEMTPLPSVEVRGTLLAHGETLKMGGSSQWTAVSMAAQGGLLQSSTWAPGIFLSHSKVFRYNGLGGTDPKRHALMA